MGRSESEKITSRALNLNAQTYQNFLTRLELMAKNVYKWENLPDTISERFLELSLYGFGNAILVKDEELGFLGLKVAPAGELNMYEEPVRYQAYSINYSKFYTAQDSVLVRNNQLMIPTERIVQLHAMRLYETQRIIDINKNAHKTPILIVCDEDNRLTMQQLYMKYEGNIPYIFGDKHFNEKDIQVLATSAPYLLDKLEAQKATEWSCALTDLGINNKNNDKKERLIVDEVNANNEQIQHNFEIGLQCRQEACDKFNKMFGMNISVKKRLVEVQKEEGEKNEYLHNTGEKSDSE